MWPNRKSNHYSDEYYCNLYHFQDNLFSMGFYTEPEGYYKTIFSDLQGAWANLRSTVVKLYPFPESERLLFHIDEGMSWESVRDFKSMSKTLLLIRNIATTSKAPKEIFEWLEEIGPLLAEAKAAIEKGEIK